MAGTAVDDFGLEEGMKAVVLRSEIKEVNGANTITLGNDHVFVFDPEAQGSEAWSHTVGGATSRYCISFGVEEQDIEEGTAMQGAGYEAPSAAPETLE